MSTYKESILIPRGAFDSMVLGKKIKSSRKVKRANSKGLSKKVKRMVPPEKTKEEIVSEYNKRFIYETAGAQARNNKAPPIAEPTVKFDIYSILKFFPKNTQYIVFRILNLMDKHSTILSYDSDDFEIIVKSQKIKNSNIIDILTFLLGMNVKYFTTSKKYKYRSKTLIREKLLENIIPEGAIEFVEKLAEILKIDNILLISDYIPEIKRKRLLVLDEARIAFRSDDQTYSTLLGIEMRREPNVEKAKENLNTRSTPSSKPRYNEEEDDDLYKMDPSSDDDELTTPSRAEGTPFTTPLTAAEETPSSTPSFIKRRKTVAEGKDMSVIDHILTKRRERKKKPPDRYSPSQYL